MAAPPDRALAAAKDVGLAELPVVRLLFRLRRLPTPPGSILEAMDGGFRVVAEEPGREVVVGSIGQPWRLRGGERRRDADFAAFDEPGFAKMAMAFRAEGGILATETRVLLTDTASRRRFRLYWLAIEPFSGLIRRLWLRAAKRRAEASK